MKKIFILVLTILSITPVLSSEADIRKNARFKALADSILVEYDDAEFKTAILRTLQKSNSTNMDLFINELENIRKGRETETEKAYGFDNIKNEYKPGMDGWRVAGSGIVVVYIGLVLIAVVVIIFNMALKDRRPGRKKVVKTAAPAVKSDPKPVCQEIPEDHLAAISVAVELYFRLYLHGRPSGNPLSTQFSPAWKSGSNFGMRKNQR